MNEKEIAYCHKLARLSPTATLEFEKYIANETLLQWPMLLAAVLLLLVSVGVPLIIVLLKGPSSLAAFSVPLLTPTACAIELTIVYPAMRKVVAAREMSSLDFFRYLAISMHVPPEYLRDFRRETTRATLRAWQVKLRAIAFVICVGVGPLLLALHVGTGWRFAIVLASIWVAFILSYLCTRWWSAFYTRTAMKSMDALWERLACQEVTSV